MAPIVIPAPIISTPPREQFTAAPPPASPVAVGALGPPSGLSAPPPSRWDNPPSAPDGGGGGAPALEPPHITPPHITNAHVDAGPRRLLEAARTASKEWTAFEAAGAPDAGAPHAAVRLGLGRAAVSDATLHGHCLPLAVTPDGSTQRSCCPLLLLRTAVSGIENGGAECPLRMPLG